MTLLPPGPHGDDAHRLAAILGIAPDAIIDLSASMNPFAPDCTDILRHHLGSLGRYPDDAAATDALAAAIGVDAGRLVLTNGGAEAIALVARHAPTGWADIEEFSLYRRHLTTLDPRGPRWQSDPHNPTGRLAAAADRASVRDEAFYLLATGTWTRGDADCTVVGSITKAWSLPGLRIGYVLARDHDEAEAIRALRPRWSTNGLVCAALPDLLARAEPAAWRDGIARLRDALVELLAGIGLIARPGAANFVWVPFAPGLRDLLLPHGIVVRDGASFGHPDAVRIAVPAARHLDRIATVLATLPPFPRPSGVL